MNTILMNNLMNNYRELRFGGKLNLCERSNNKKIKYYVELLNRNANKEYVEKDYAILKRLFDYCNFGYNIVKLDEDYYGKKIFERSSNTYALWDRDYNVYKYYLRTDCVYDICYDYRPKNYARFFTIDELYDEVCEVESVDKSDFISYCNNSNNYNTVTYEGKVGVWVINDIISLSNLINNIISNIQESKYEIYNYHCYPEFKTQKLENEEVDNHSLMGVELEIEGDDIQLSSCRSMISRRFPCYFSEDCSLECGNGMECVSHPMSKGYRQSQEFKNNIIDMFDKLNNEYGLWHDNNCGGHIHYSRPKNPEVINRVAYILEQFKEEIKLFSRRNGNFNWCKFWEDWNNLPNWVNRALNKMPNKKSKAKYNKVKIDFTKEYIENENNDHCLALNLQHTKTIEFRIFKGYTTATELLGSMELVDNIMRLANSNRIVENIKLKELFKGEYCEQLAKQQGIKLEEVK